MIYGNNSLFWPLRHADGYQIVTVTLSESRSYHSNLYYNIQVEDLLLVPPFPLDLAGWPLELEYKLTLLTHMTKNLSILMAKALISVPMMPMSLAPLEVTVPT